MLACTIAYLVKNKVQISSFSWIKLTTSLEAIFVDHSFCHHHLYHSYIGFSCGYILMKTLKSTWDRHFTLVLSNKLTS